MNACPKAIIHWGVLRNSAEITDWVKSVLAEVKNGIDIDEAAKTLFEDLTQVGYEEGYDSCQTDNEEFN